MSEQKDFKFETVVIPYKNIHDLIKNLKAVENNPSIGDNTRIELSKFYIN